MNGIILGLPLIAVFFAVVLLETRPSRTTWRLCNVAFTLVAIAWGVITGYGGLYANAFWDTGPAPNMGSVALSILIGPALCLAGIALAWLGFSKRRLGLTLTGPVVVAVAPLAVLAALQME